MKKSAIISTILAFALTWALPTQAQPSAKNTIFFEGLGNGMLYTINYDRMMSDTWSARVGLMSFSDTDDFEAGGVGVTTTIGYRYQRPGGGINFRIGLTPLLHPSFIPWGGLSLGYTF